MHICLKCARVAKTVDEIENGCPCGSKVFVYKRDEPECKRLEPIKPIQNGAPKCEKNGCAKHDSDDEPGHEYSEVWLSKGAKISDIAEEEDCEDSGEPKIENIRQIKRGIFEVDLLGLKKGPLVVRDQEGVYYVRLPFEHTQEDG